MIDIRKAIELWFRLRDTPKETLKVFCNTDSFYFGDYYFKKDVEEALALDPEGITALLIMDTFWEDFVGGCSLSIRDILHNPNAQDFLEDCRKLEKLLTDPDAMEKLRMFIDRVSSAVSQMGIDRDDVRKRLSDRYAMSILRLDSLRSMKNLHLHQFFQGDKAADHLAFLPDIHVFWNMDSLIRCAWQSQNGVSINLIKDPEAYSSFFAIVAKNGGNLTVLTDQEKQVHPSSKYMTRRPERGLTARAFRNHFPYHLLDIKVDYKGNIHPGRTSIVPLQEKPVKVGSLAELEPDEILWSVMMFSLIDAKLYKENYHCAELSYTGNMLACESYVKELVAGATSSALLVRDYKPITLPKISVSEISDLSQYKKYPGSGLNEWLFERYKDKIPAKIMNGLKNIDSGAEFLLADGSMTEAGKEQIRKIGYTDELRLVKEGSNHHFPDFVNDAVYIRRLSPDTFGSKDAIIRDYEWVARYNAAKFVRQQAEKEFEERKQEILEWIHNKVESNLESICTDIVAQNDTDRRGMPCRFGITYYKSGWPEGCFGTGSAFVRFVKHPNPSIPKFRCWFSEDAPCSYFLSAKAINIQDLLYLTGCNSVSEFPDVLQKWHDSNCNEDGLFGSRYTGNSILERVDPMDWVCKSPWDDIHIKVVVSVGKKWMKKKKDELKKIDYSKSKKGWK